ncbi:MULTISPECIES: hypothetical protein [Stutzerimonas]|uniref:hypothetical protein n=1 Tax=Stutzerimonas TaxID=2901164 RepID=UPI001909879E|nr:MULTISPECIES: hypothetical protein [Stutzerimonas]MBK3919907.1 hypothetical protein [Stutzerimonas frequens]
MPMSVQKPVTTFELIEFNHVRDARGKEAAKIRVIENGESQGFLWMSAEDLRANIRDLGPSDALSEALRAYGGKV